MLNGSRLKGLLKYNSLLGGDFPVEVQCLSTCNIEIEEEEFLVLWEYTHVTETDESPGEDSDLKNQWRVPLRNRIWKMNT